MKLRSILESKSKSRGLAKSKNLEIDTIEHLIDTKFSEAYNNPVTLYRGIDSSTKQAFIYNPSGWSSLRGSLTRRSVKLNFVRHLPSWRNIPDRGKSIFTTTNMSHSRSFGFTYVVLPINGAKMATVPIKDFNDINLFGNLSSDIMDLWIYNPIGRSLNDPVTREQFYDIIEQLNNEEGVQLLLKHEFGGRTLLSVLDKAMEPSKFGVQIHPVSELNVNMTGEIWTESPCLLIEFNLYQEIRKRKNEKT